MAELFSRYASGTQWTAGVIVGNVDGVSGLNPIVDRLNSISTSDNLVVGSVVSGTSLSIYSGSIAGTISGTSTIIYAGSINQTNGLIIIENRTSDPASPATGRIWIRTDL